MLQLSQHPKIQNIQWIKKNYLRLGHTFLMVKELIKKIVKEAIKACAEKDNRYWLKFYHFAGEIGKTVFDELQAKRIQELKDEELENL